MKIKLEVFYNMSGKYLLNNTSMWPQSKKAKWQKDIFQLSICQTLFHLLWGFFPQNFPYLYIFLIDFHVLFSKAVPDIYHNSCQLRTLWGPSMYSMAWRPQLIIHKILWEYYFSVKINKQGVGTVPLYNFIILVKIENNFAMGLYNLTQK